MKRSNFVAYAFIGRAKNIEENVNKSYNTQSNKIHIDIGYQNSYHKLTIFQHWS